MEPSLESLPLRKRLLTLGDRWLRYEEPEVWTDRDFQAPDESVLKSYFDGLFRASGHCLPEIAFTGFWLSGIRERHFAPVATWGGRDAYTASPVKKTMFPHVNTESIYKASSDQIRAMIGRTPKEPCWLVDLYSRNEHLGFAGLFCYPEKNLTPVPEAETVALLVLLRRMVGDAVFSYRMRLLSSHIATPSSQPTQKEYCEAAARQLAHGMGVDGAVIRLYRPEHDSLDITGKEGELGEIANDPEAEKERVKICKRVFESPEGFAFLPVLAQQPSSSQPESSVQLKKEEEELLQMIDVNGWALHRLESNRCQAGPFQRLGTLAVYCRDPRAFSKRDIALLRTFCERTADELALLQAKEELDSFRVKLESSMDATTRAELVALLAHDLFARVAAVKQEVSDFKRAAIKAIKDHRNADYLGPFSQKLNAATEDLENRVQEIKAAHRRLDEKANNFDVVEVAEAVREMILPILRGISMECSISRSAGNLRVFGVSGVWRMVLFNLAINAIDAQKSLRHKGENILHIRCREIPQGANRSVVVLVSDGGPGINRQAFPNLQSVFEMGKTSKATGTGLGLPVSRSLMQTYFRGSLNLINDKPATFEAILRDAITKK